MKSGLLSYSGVTTKIRAMSANFIDEATFREIVALPNVSAVASYLKVQPAYSGVLSELEEQHYIREELERYLEHAVFYDFEKMYHFAGEEPKRFLKSYSRRYEVPLLKNCIARILEGSGPSPKEKRLNREFFLRYTELPFDDLCEADSMEALIAALGRSPYAAVLRSTIEREGSPTLYQYETALDLHHFSTVWKDIGEITEDSDSKEILTRFLGTKFDMLNLWYLHRARTYFSLTEPELYALTIPVLYRLKKAEIKALVTADTEEAFRQALQETWYARRYPELKPENLQYMYAEVCTDIMSREAAKHPYSIASLYHYLFRKEHEVYRLITAIECVRYSLPVEEALRYTMSR